jgi:adsorption protein B
MVVREILDGSIPAAGVGCAFSRRALEALSAFNHNELFSVDSLTEDYDIGLRLKQLDLSQAFVKVSLPKTVLKRVWWKRGEAQVSAPDYVCVREYFPSHWRAATRQKSRWVVGIALQGWASLGWSGSLATRYMLARDRKALITNLANVLGYVIVIALLIVWIGMWLAPDPYRFPPLVEHSWWLWYVIMINGAFFLLRVLMRAYCVQRFHGWREAALSAPRMIWGNFINFAATARAIRLYARYLWTGNPIAWDKTAHAYPSADGLQEFSRRLGERLLQHSLVTVGQLEEALKRQHDEKRLLGAILCDMGALRGEDLDAVLEGRFKRQAA